MSPDPETIYILGDIHTVSAFKAAGATGIDADEGDVREKIMEISMSGDAAVIIVTSSLAQAAAEEIVKINNRSGTPAVIEIPGIYDAGGFRKSAIEYITEALGIAL